MKKIYLVLTLVIAIVSLAVIISLVALSSPPTVKDAQTPVDVATILAVVGLGSVGIERLIEGIWSIVDMSLGWSWPLHLITKQINDSINSLNQPLEPFFNKLQKLVDEGNTAAGTLTPETLKQQYDTIKNDMAQLETVVSARGAVSKSDPITTIEQKLLNLKNKYNFQIDDQTIEKTASTIQDSAKALDDLVQSFTDNPGRRLISLFGGALLGLGVAWVLRLDLLATVLTSSDKHYHYPVSWGIISAGLVMGLGSSPAHEIIQAIMNWRKNL